LFAEEVPAVPAASGASLQKGSSVVFWMAQDCVWIAGNVIKAWSNGKVDVCIGEADCVQQVSIYGKEVFPLEESGAFFRLQLDGSPGYSQLLSDGEVPFANAAPGYGILVRGQQLMVILPEEFVVERTTETVEEGGRTTERVVERTVQVPAQALNGTLVGIGKDWQLDVLLEDTSHKCCTTDQVYPLEAYTQQQEAMQQQGGDDSGDMFTGLLAGMAMEEAVGDADDW